MSNGIPVRLSAGLTARTRAAAALQDRSLTDQVEHWAKLGQAVEAVSRASTVDRLKARFDESLPKLLASADTAAGQAKAAKLIRARNAVRHGIDRAGKRTKSSR